MSKRTIFTTITPLPSHVTRETVIETLHTHTEMIDLNPLVIERHPIKPPGKATAEEFHCTWYSITDRISYLPGGIAKGKVTYSACFHNLANGLQTHVYAPAGLDIKEKWSVGGSLPGEPQQPVEIGQGIPLSGLYLREDIDMTCNFMMTSFVRKTLQGAHSKLIGRLVVKTQLSEREKDMERMTQASISSGPSSPGLRYSDSVHSAQTPCAGGILSPGFPSPNASQGRMSYQSDPRVSMMSTGSSSGNFKGFASPGVAFDPLYASADANSQQPHGQHGGYAPMQQQQHQIGYQQQQVPVQSFVPSELPSNETNGKGKSWERQGYVAELPAEMPVKQVER